MPNQYSPLPVKMADKEDGDTTVYHTTCTNQIILPLNLTASEKSEQTTSPSVEHEIAAHATVDADREPTTVQPKQEYAKVMTGSDGAVNGDCDRSGEAERSCPDGGKPALQPSRDHQLPSRSKTSSRKKSELVVSSKSRYDATVGPLTNIPAVNLPDFRSHHHNDRRVPSPGPVRSAGNPGYTIGAASRPVEPAYCRPYTLVRFAHQLPAMVTCPRPHTRSTDVGSGVVTERQIQAVPHRAPAPVPAAPPPQQQQFAVDPSYNLYMAVECHRATAQDEDGDTPLHIALSQEEVDMRLIVRLVELIQLAGRSLDIFNDMQQTPLHIAAITGNPEAARILVEHGANANETDRNGQTAMHNVCSNPSSGSSATLDAILRFARVKADPDKRNYSGFTPMHISVKHGLYSLTKLLIDHGANINCLDAKSGWTPLFHAVTNQDIEHVQILLCGNSQVNMQSYSGNTALHVATGRGLTEIVRLLMRYGADMSLRNTHKDTPGMVATDNNMSNILRGVAPTSPSLGSCGSPRYSSPSPHHQHPPLTNGVILLPKQSPSLQCINHRVPSPTATPLMKHGDAAAKRLAERPPRAGKRERGSRRSSAAKLENVSCDQAVRQTAPSKTPTDGSKVTNGDPDDALSVTRRVSVIVVPKSLKRRLIERTEREEQSKSSTSSSMELCIPVKIAKAELEVRSPRADGDAERVNGVSESERLQPPRESERWTHSPSQLEPIDLTKRKRDETSGPRDLVTHSPSSSVSSFSVDDDKMKQGESAEEHLGNGEASREEKDADGEAPQETGVENKLGGGDAAEAVAKTVDDASSSNLPKKERKRKKNEKLPPKKRK